MAKGNAVWGIDIGQCSLKALRCTYDARGEQVVAEACDFIEYEKILSQPDADPQVLVRDAIKEFLSRNSVRGDQVAISVAGQQGLARFIKLPPVEAKKLPKIVEFEAKQQIPFALEDVIWDYQMLVGGVDADGMALENEVGLFAMKRDQVMRAIRPLDDAGVELDVIQLSPVSVFNTGVHSLMGDLPPLTDFDPDNPPPSVVVLSMGTDTTDLVVTNGYRVWQRSIPLGGNHFTKQLTKELKLTFGKAEHLKRNSREADDPKRVFQAMRPVFNDLVTEIQRSIGYFESLDRNAKISHIVGTGNAFKLPGLEPYLEKNLGHKVQVVNSYRKLTGPALEDAKFKQNLQSMAVPLGLAIQGLGQAKLRTNLVPRELVQARMIRRKKPWVLAAAAALLVGFALNYAQHSIRAMQVDASNYEDKMGSLNQVSSTSSGFKSSDDESITNYAALKSVGDQVVGNSDRRFQMLELMKAIDVCLPREPGLAPGEVTQRPVDAKKEDEQRVELYIENMDMEFFGTEEKPLAGDEGWWGEAAKVAYKETLNMLATTAEPAAGDATAEPAADEATEETGEDGEPLDDEADAEGDDAEEGAEEEVDTSEIEDLEGSGWVVELSGYHYHNLRPPMFASEYVRRTLVKNLMTKTVDLPYVDENGQQQMGTFTMEEMGITHAIIAFDGSVELTSVPNPDWAPPNAFEEEQRAATDGGVGGVKPVRQQPGVTARVQLDPDDPDAKPKSDVPREFKPRTHKFKVHFLWRPNTMSERLERRRQPDDQGDSTDNQVAGG